jgi:hypothetical protein
MSEHTKEPWTATNFSFKSKGWDDPFPVIQIKGAGDVPIIAMAPEEIDQANARRIVACVNACAGIDTEKLEQVAKGERLLIMTRD